MHALIQLFTHTRNFEILAYRKSTSRNSYACHEENAAGIAGDKIKQRTRLIRLSILSLYFHH